MTSLANVKRPGSRSWPLMQRLLHWSKVDPSTFCREWTGSTYPSGHGMIRWKRRLWRAHRLMWIEKRGPIPAGRQVLHKCGNARCIEVSHLYLGNDADNTADKIRMGRLRVGRHHGMAKLTDAQVRDIRSRKLSGAEYAAKHGVSRGWVYTIWRRERWKHL